MHFTQPFIVSSPLGPSIFGNISQTAFYPQSERPNFTLHISTSNITVSHLYTLIQMCQYCY